MTHKGAFNNYVDRILPFFDPPPLRGQFLYPERGQKQTFFDPFPPHLVHVVIEWPLAKSSGFCLASSKCINFSSIFPVQFSAVCQTELFSILCPYNFK